MLPLAYDPRIPDALLEEMERAARDVGLPLRAMEHVGSRWDLCVDFVLAARRGDLRRLRTLARSPDPISR
ncbi:MAG TPA: hypothetical protein VGR28_11755 [Candidatus Thermoplasmatota archaeon]|nr:hypothetical protein [Candidatus Thermoplasmatota archaeon]